MAGSSRPTPAPERAREVFLAPTDFQDYGTIWFGRNKKEHGSEFFLGLSGGETASVRIPEKDRKKVAALLRRFARRLAP